MNSSDHEDGHKMYPLKRYYQSVMPLGHHSSDHEDGMKCTHFYVMFETWIYEIINLFA